MDLYSLQQWLGHDYISTTTRYLHLVRPDVHDGARREPLNLLGALPKDIALPRARPTTRRKSAQQTSHA